MKLRLIDHPHFAFGLDPGGCEVVDCAGPTACSCGTRHTFLELVWWVRVAHCAWLSFRGFPYFSGNDGCGVSGLPPAILPTYAFSARLIEGPLREYDKLARQCAAEGLDHIRFLLRLAELELIDRERRMVERRIKEARFPAVKSLDSFDFAAIPSLNKTLVLELARSEYVTRRENIIAVGNSGTGKTHIGLGLGLAAGRWQQICQLPRHGD